MARAQLLHGVTMREAGVSAAVPVRFEDWPAEAQAGAGRRAA